MKKIILTAITTAGLAALISGCSSEPKPKSVAAYERDFKTCTKNIEGIMKVMDQDMERTDLLEMKSEWIDNCMREDKGWRKDELKDVREDKKMLNGEWGFDHDSMQP